MSGRTIGRRRFLQGIGAGTAVSLAGCTTENNSGGETSMSKTSTTTSSSGSSSTDTIKIGQVTPLTGSAKVYGLPHSAGHDMAVNDINDNGGVEINGKTHQLEFIVKDGEAKPSVAKNAATQLIKDEEVDLLISGNIPTAVLAYTDLVKESNTFLLNDGNESIDLHFMDYKPMFSPFTTIYSPNYPNLSRLYPMGTYTVNELGFEKVAFLTPNLSYGYQAEDYLAKSVKSAGGTVAEKVHIDNGTSDFTNAITKLKSVDADAIIATIFPYDFFQFLKQADQQGLRDKSQIITAQAPSEDVASQLVSPDIADGFYGYGMTFPTAKLAAENGLLAKEPFERRVDIKSRFQKAYPDRTFTYIATRAYEGVNLLKYAMESSGGYDNDSLVKGMESMTYEDIKDFTTQYYIPPEGSVDGTTRKGAIFDKNHQAYYENSVQKWKKGKKTLEGMIRVGDYWN